MKTFRRFPKYVAGAVMSLGLGISYLCSDRLFDEHIFLMGFGFSMALGLIAMDAADRWNHHYSKMFAKRHLIIGIIGAIISCVIGFMYITETIEFETGIYVYMGIAIVSGLIVLSTRSDEYSPDSKKDIENN